MKKRFGPTLARRVFFASVIAFAAAWIAVIGVYFFMQISSETEELLQWVENESRTVERFTSAQEAAAFMTSQSRFYNQNEGQKVFLELWSRDGTRVFFDEQRVYPYAPLTGDRQHTICGA